MSSSSFNEMPQPPLNDVEAGTINAISRWTRGRKPAAPVSRIDPRHRYGNNLHLYYDVWITSESKQPFFNWSDDGDGKEVNLEQCPRTDRQHQVDLEWIFLIANFVLELPSAAFDQLSSVHKPQFLLLSIVELCPTLASKGEMFGFIRW
ncbi:hypothetical protein CICLE_v10004011mg [Citrus x clementina]|uniref:Uncharacterized protein n=1 Tax=Citrus clementina TaxID=85681 RepID=V4T5W6_CITCL|nr:hypothetical protein CICLE_v10004011mg [Citrus x clementina]